MRWSFRTNGNYIDFVHTDETSEAVESTIFHLHNTSRCVSWSLPSDTTRINFTIDEVKYSNILITDIDFDGTAMDSQDDFETGIEAMFPGLASSPGGDSGLLSESVILTDAQMKAWVNTPVQALAGEAGKVKWVVRATYIKNTAAGAYVTSNNNITIYYDNNFGTSIFGAAPNFDSITPEVGLEFATDNLLELAELENINVMIGGTGVEYTGGNAANTFTVTLYYIEVAV